MAALAFAASAARGCQSACRRSYQKSNPEPDCLHLQKHSGKLVVWCAGQVLAFMRRRRAEHAEARRRRTPAGEAAAQRRQAAERVAARQRDRQVAAYV